MKVFLAGGSGAIGIPLIRALRRAGHEVTALTRSAAKADRLRALGAIAAVADALDADALTRVVLAAHPTHVIHELTALPPMVRKASDLEPTNRLRTDGTGNLLDAALAAGARRIVAGSFAPLAAARDQMDGRVDRAGAALTSMESQVLDANASGRIEGIVLRYGLFYGSETSSTRQMLGLVRRRLLPVVRGDRSLLPLIHVDDAAAATVAALDRGTPGGVYDIVDDQAVNMTDLVMALAASVGAPRPLTVPAWLPRIMSPYLARVTSVRLQLSNAKARAELGWRPAYPTYRDGLREAARAAA